MMKRDFYLVEGGYGRRIENRMLGTDRLRDMVVDGGMRKYFRVMNSVTNRGEGNGRTTKLLNQ